MLISDLIDALDALDSSGRLRVDGPFPHLRFGFGGYFNAPCDVGWNPMFLRMFAEIETAAALAKEIINLKAVLGLRLDKFDRLTGSVTLPKSCRTLKRKFNAEAAHRCELCGARGEQVMSRPFESVRCALHVESSGMAETSRPPTLSAHIRMPLAGRFGARDWREVQPPSNRSFQRAYVVDEGVAFAVSLRADPKGAAVPSVVATALTNADGSVLGLWGKKLLDREADLAARIAASLWSS